MSQSCKRKKIRSLNNIYLNKYLNFLKRSLNNKCSFYIENKCTILSRQLRLSATKYAKQTKPTEWSIFTTSNKEELPAAASFPSDVGTGSWETPPKRDHQGEGSWTQDVDLGKYHHAWGNKNVNRIHIKMFLWLLETAQLELERGARVKNYVGAMDPLTLLLPSSLSCWGKCLTPRD